MGSMRRRLAVVALLAVGLVALGGCDWLQWGGSQTHEGVSPDSLITPDDASQLHQRWQVALPDGDVADGAPAYAEDVDTPGGKRNLLVVTASYGNVYALDAATGAVVWRANASGTSCAVNGTGGRCFTTSSPAIDPAKQHVYSYEPATGLVHKYELGTGAESTAGGWPEVTTRKPIDEKGSSALTIGTFDGHSYLYVTHSGYPGDRGDYQGHVTVIDLATGAQKVFNTLCSDQAVHFVHSPGTPDCGQVTSGVWARPGVLADPDTNKVYLVTGNGDWNPTAHDWGDTVLAVNPDGTGSTSGDPLDTWTPSNYRNLQSTDTDLGSSAPARLPAVSGAGYAHLGVVGGKDGLVRFLNLDDLSGQGGPGHLSGEVGTPTFLPQGGQVLAQPVIWTDPQGQVWVLTASRYGPANPSSHLSSGISGQRVVAGAGGVPTFAPGWVHGPGPASMGTPAVSTSGVLFTLADRAILAYDAATGRGLWMAPLPGVVHWQSPVIGTGQVFVEDDSGHVTSWGL